MATGLIEPVDLAELDRADCYAWTKHRAEALRQLLAARPNLPLDLGHLIEEVDGSADTNLIAVESQLRRIMVHFLKLGHGPSEPLRRKWAVSIIDAQAEIDDRSTAPMRGDVEPRLARQSAKARRIAKGERIGRAEPQAAAGLPEACPYTLDQLLDETRRPTNRHGLVDAPF